MIQYKIINTSDPGQTYQMQLQPILDRLGMDGWELRGIVNGNLMIFHRKSTGQERPQISPLPPTVSLKDLYRLHELEHKLWSKGKADASSYDKPLWNELDRLIGRVGSAIAGEGWVTKAIEEAKQEAP